EGEVVADKRFRPSDNGFPFQNYGDQLADGSGQASGLTAAEMQQLYGKAVCANDNCDLTPEAQAYMEKSNKDMAGGHCFGFSVAAELLWSGKLNASDYGADNTAGLRINENAKLMGTIAYTWMFQTLPSVQQQFVQGDPNAILEKLKEVLTPNPDETYTVRIFHG